MEGKSKKKKKEILSWFLRPAVKVKEIIVCLLVIMFMLDTNIEVPLFKTTHGTKKMWS